MEHITKAMIPEFEFDEATTIKFNAWAALESIEDGMDDKDALLVYGVTKADLEPYRAEWEALKK